MVAVIVFIQATAILLTARLTALVVIVVAVIVPVLGAVNFDATVAIVVMDMVIRMITVALIRL